METSGTNTSLQTKNDNSDKEKLTQCGSEKKKMKRAILKKDNSETDLDGQQGPVNQVR